MNKLSFYVIVGQLIAMLLDSKNSPDFVFSKLVYLMSMYPQPLSQKNKWVIDALASDIITPGSAKKWFDIFLSGIVKYRNVIMSRLSTKDWTKQEDITHHDQDMHCVLVAMRKEGVVKALKVSTVHEDHWYYMAKSM